jgi:hypothetical protein
LHRLKRQFGAEIIVYKAADVTQNLKTGVISRQYITTTVKRAIVLPVKSIRDFVYDLSFIAANKNFTYGAFFDISYRAVIIDQKDLPSGTTFTQDDYIVYEGVKYGMRKTERITNDYGWILMVTTITGAEEVS